MILAATAFLLAGCLQILVDVSSVINLRPNTLVLAIVLRYFYTATVMSLVLIATKNVYANL